MWNPRLIQGGPNLALATWPLARAVAAAGELGVITGDVLPAVLARRLQLGDFDGHLRSVLESFPFTDAFRRVWERFYIPGGKDQQAAFELVGQPTLEDGPALLELTVLANFAEVFLAKQGHAGAVGIHYHDSARLALLPSLYGALIAGVDHLLINARAVPATLHALRRLLAGEAAALEAAGPGTDSLTCGFDPRALGPARPVALRAPALIAICQSTAEAASVARLEGFNGGYVVAVDDAGWREPEELAQLRALGRPFWMGGAAATAANFSRARAAGAAGLQVNTPFTFCAESALNPELKRQVLTLVRQDPANLFTQICSLPDGRPLRVLRLEDTAADPEVLAQRARVCDVGWFREVYRRADGSVGYRCPGEPLHHYVLKGGAPGLAARQPCICNGLLAGLGLAQVQYGRELERALIPAGEDVRELTHFLKPGGEDFTAAEVIAVLTGAPAPAPATGPH